MARIPSLIALGASAALALTSVGVGADGPVPSATTSTSVAYPSTTSYPAASTSGSVYGGWTTPQPGRYGSWTTPQPSRYGTWTTPQAGHYGSWSTSTGSSRAYGSPSAPAVPATATVVSPGPSSSWSPICEPTCATKAWHFGVWAKYWRPTISGDVLITLGGTPGSGTSTDVDDDLDLDPADGWEGGLSAGYGRHRLTLAYESDSFSGASTLDRTIVYHGQTFLAGTAIDSDVDLTIWKFGYDYAFVGDPANAAGVTVRGGISGWLWDYDGRVRSATQDTSRSFSHVLPVATLDAEGTFGWFHADAGVHGGWLASDRYVIDLEASVGVKLWHAASLDVGYRWMNLSFHETTNEGDLTLSGPFAGISIVF